MSAHKLYGYNRVFCKGRLISGPDAKSCIASFLMILVPSVMWHATVGKFFAERYSPLIPVLTGIFQAMSLSLLLCTAFSDPGIMPRQKEHVEVYDPRTKTYRSKQPPRYHDLVLRGHPFKLKYCTTCNIYRPPRCTHCSVCDNCIERFDHHCPWIGNCIGKRNYWLFYSFVTTTGTLNVTVLGTAVAHLAVLTQEYQDALNKGSGDALLQSMQEEPLSAVIVVYTAAIVWFTVGLCMYHSYLICTNQTTYEQIKGVYSGSSGGPAAAANPFHRSIAGNCHDILCSRVRPRFFNPYDGRLTWPRVPADEARDLKINTRPVSGNADNFRSALSDRGLSGPRDGAQAQSMMANHVVDDPFLSGNNGEMALSGNPEMNLQEDKNRQAAPQAKQAEEL